MRYIALALGLVLAACAPQAKTYMLDSETASISGRGSALHDHGQVTKVMLQEAARQALQRGYAYFRILQAVDRSTSGTTVAMSPTTYINAGGGTVMALPGPANASPYTKPAAEIMVRFYKERPNAPNVWDARAVLAEK